MTEIQHEMRPVQSNINGNIPQCAICNTEVTATASHCIARAEFQRIVANGFNPFTENITVRPGLTLVDLGSAYGLSPEDQYQRWKENALASAADRILCDRCYHLANQYSR